MLVEGCMELGHKGKRVHLVVELVAVFADAVVHEMNEAIVQRTAHKRVTHTNQLHIYAQHTHRNTHSHPLYSLLYPPLLAFSPVAGVVFLHTEARVAFVEEINSERVPVSHQHPSTHTYIHTYIHTQTFIHTNTHRALINTSDM